MSNFVFLLFDFYVWSYLSGSLHSQVSQRHIEHTFKVFVDDPQVFYAVFKSSLYDMLY